MKKWILETCIESASQYRTRSEWYNNEQSAYVIASKNGWLIECCRHMDQIRRPKLSFEDCKHSASHHQTRAAWVKADSSAYYAATRSGWLKACCEHMVYDQRPNGTWTFEACINEALKHNTKSAWNAESIASYSKAYKMGWFSECTKHMLDGNLLRADKYRIWTKEACKADALNYKTRTEWNTKSTSAYQIAIKNNWDQECCKHMKVAGGESQLEQELRAIIKKQFPSACKIFLGKKTKGQFGAGFELDIYIPELQKGIEFNGDYWHSPEGLKRGRPDWSEEMIKYYHELKRKFFQDRGIEILEVWEHEWKQDTGMCLHKIEKFLG